MVENSLEIPEGWGGYHCYPKMENPKGWGVLYEIPSVVGVWIFSGNTHFKVFEMVLRVYVLHIIHMKS